MIIRVEKPDGSTVVPNRFIDEYMSSANGEYVKVYLLLLRLAERGDVTDTELADRLNMPERDVQRAVKYWAKAGLLPSQEPEEAAASAEKPAESAAQQPEQRKTAPERRSYSPTQIREVRNDHADFDDALFAVERYLNRTLSSRDLDRLTYLYQDLKFPGSLIEYLVEHCVDCKHTEMNYIERVALEWHREGKTTVEQARDGNAEFSALRRSLKKALGIGNRVFNDEEQACIARWQGEEGCPDELILEAARRTIRRINKPDFSYMQKILGDWRTQGLTTLEQVKAADDRRAAARGEQPAAGDAAESKTGGTRASGRSRGGRNDFDFEQHHYDYDAILRREA